jgi:uncharacterized membrane protein
MTPIASVSRAAATGRWSLRQSPLRLLGDQRVSAGLIVMAAGEILADKTPFIPSRTQPGAWLWRSFMGGVVGAAASINDEDTVWSGALAGAGAAAVSTYVAYQARMALQRLGLPNPAAGMVGDIEALGLSLAALLTDQPKQKGKLPGWLGRIRL